VLAFVDTNVLLYSVSGATSDQVKAGLARTILDGEDCVLSVQVLQEFYVQATRETGAFRLPHELAQGFIKTWLRFQVVNLTPRLLMRALQIKDESRLSYWDAAVIAAAERAGCREILTEDLNHGQAIAGVTIVNPFL
jgi:predicted nucleic acid-binding protein